LILKEIKEKFMKEPQILIDARERANEAADERQAAYDDLNAMENATMDDTEKWLAVHHRTLGVQHYFERLLQHVYYQEPYPSRP
jgi:hypothetical protein